MKMRIRSVLIALIAFLFITVFSFPVESYADSNYNHQHQRLLQRIVIDADESETPFCGEFYCRECRESYYDSITYEDLGIPIVNIKGSLAGISKTQKVTVNITYASDQLVFDSDATLKLQGSSSLGYPKKNYSLQFIKANGKKNKVTLIDSWNSQSKYCLKANYVDYSQSRNVVSGRLFSEVLHFRNINDELNELSNGGVVDGYPVAVFLNEKYLGLYTMNIPKDKWMFGMDDDTVRQALLFGDTWSESVKLKEPISDVNNVSGSGWDLEYCSTEEDESIGTSWVAESMNDFIEFLNSNDGEDFKNGIDQYTDIDRVIDVLIFTYFIQARDNVSKNIIWATYNGIKWIPSVYDMDGSWGMVWDGSFSYSASEFPPSDGNLLFKRLIDNYPNEIKARYAELRQSILSNSNIQMQFASFLSDIPQVMYMAESEKWAEVPSQNVNNFDQIFSFAKARAEYLDNYYGVTVDETESAICKATFNGLDGIKIFVYKSQDYINEPQQSTVAFSRTEEGELTQHDGQVDFLIVPPKGYLVDTVTVAPGDGFKDLEGEEETGKENTYRITKIKKDLNVNIDIKEHTDHISSGNVKYTWEDDYSTCIASDICNVCGLEYGETSESVYTVERASSCSQEGAGEYIAHFDNPIFEDQEKEIIIETVAHTPSDPVKENEVAATCDKDGSYDEVVYCSSCKEEIGRDKKAVAALGHTWSEEYTVDKTETCTEEGARSVHCTRCNAMDESTVQATPAIGHAYGDPTYTWANDYSTVTASMTCSNESNHVISETAKTTAEVTKVATYTEKGETTYTGVFTNKSFYTQTKTVDNIDKLQPEETTPAPTNSEPSVGESATVSAGTVKITSSEGKTVSFSAAKNVMSVVVPDTVTIEGMQYKVTQIDANAFKAKKIRTVTIGKNVKNIKKNAFKGSPATKLIVKTKLLKKAKVKGCLKGSKIKIVQVKVGNKATNKKFVTNYKKIFTKENTGSKVTVKYKV